MKFNEVKFYKFTDAENAVKEILQIVAEIEPEYNHDLNSTAIFWGHDTDCGPIEEKIKDGLKILRKYDLINGDRN